VKRLTTRIWQVHPERPDPQRIAQAAEILRRGGLVAFPTETVYGLGANALDARAVQRIFAAKGRPSHDPLIVHVATAEDLQQVAREVSSLAEQLTRTFWPGPLTLVLPKASAIPDEVTSGRPTVAVRCPAHPVALALIRAASVPIAAPSANRFGHTSPTTAQHVLDDLGGQIDLILDAGPTPVGVESTVLDLTQRPPVILRPGGLPKETLEAHIGEVGLADGVTAPGPAPSPGMLPRHYAPNTPLWLFLGSRMWALHAMDGISRRWLTAGRKVGVLVSDKDREYWSNAAVTMESLGAEGDYTAMAQRLYSALRELDAAGLDLILTRDFGGEGLGLAIRDRLVRAAVRVIRPGEERSEALLPDQT